MGGQSKTHNWSPKIFWRLLNIATANAYTLYKALVETYTPERKPLEMIDAISLAMQAFCQRGQSMRKQKAEHPSFMRDVSCVHGPGSGQKVRSDVKGVVAEGQKGPATIGQEEERRLQKRQIKEPW